MRRPASFERLTDLYEEMLDRESRYVGFPNSRIFDHADLGRFLRFPINNIGDPFRPNNGINTCALEQEVMTFFASLFGLAPDAFWGHLTNGGTEGNMFGMFLAREAFPDGVVYFSEDVHYSLYKIVHLLRMESRVVPATPSGQIDTEAFREIVAAHPGRPVVVNANIGTTIKGAIDDVPRLLAILDGLGVRQRYVHCDAALFGCMLPFVTGAPPFDFSLPIDSLSLSGHKFLGSPIPCGVVLTRHADPPDFYHGDEYVGSRDCTISGSRDGLSVLILWQSLMTLGREGIAELVDESMRLADYALDAVTRVGWSAWKNPHSCIVVIDAPGEELVRKWQLAVRGDVAHLVLLPGVTREVVDAFALDLAARVAVGSAT